MSGATMGKWQNWDQKSRATVRSRLVTCETNFVFFLLKHEAGSLLSLLLVLTICGFAALHNCGLNMWITSQGLPFLPPLPSPLLPLHFVWYGKAHMWNVNDMLLRILFCCYLKCSTTTYFDLLFLNVKEICGALVAADEMWRFYL